MSKGGVEVVVAVVVVVVVVVCWVRAGLRW